MSRQRLLLGRLWARTEEGFEPPTPWFLATFSNPLSHFFTRVKIYPNIAQTHKSDVSCALKKTEKSVNKAEPCLAARRIKAHKHKDSNLNREKCHAKAPIEIYNIHMGFIIYSDPSSSGSFVLFMSLLLLVGGPQRRGFLK